MMLSEVNEIATHMTLGQVEIGDPVRGTWGPSSSPNLRLITVVVVGFSSL